MTSSNWTSVHVFYAGDQDRLLVELLRPELGRLRRDGASRRDFFIRNWNGGPHVRVRIDLDEAHDDTIDSFCKRVEVWLRDQTRVEPDADAYRHVASRMGRRRAQLDTEWRGLIEDVEPLRMAAGVERRTYAFDSLRFGSGASVDAIEDHYSRSSELALAVIDHWQNWTAGQRLALSFLLGAAALDVLPGERADLSRVLEEFGRHEEVDAATGSPSIGPAIDDADLLPLRSQVRQGLPNPSVGPWENAVLELVAEEFRNLRASMAPGGVSNTIDLVHLFFNRLGIPLRLEQIFYRALVQELRTDSAEAETQLQEDSQ